MAGDIQAGVPVLVMHEQDHVATALKELKQGEAVEFRIADRLSTVTPLDVIPFGHKIAIVEIPEGTEVRKYGDVIGRATVRIAAGQHVHVHNIEGIRGRGDQAKKEGVL